MKTKNQKRKKLLVGIGIAVMVLFTAFCAFRIKTEIVDKSADNRHEITTTVVEDATMDMAEETLDKITDTAVSEETTEPETTIPDEHEMELQQAEITGIPDEILPFIDGDITGMRETIDEFVQLYGYVAEKVRYGGEMILNTDEQTASLVMVIVGDTNKEITVIYDREDKTFKISR